jgi:protocatechuate 3,4-dioxygenase beta subunit
VWLLTIADNGSTDDSWSTATALAETLPSTRAARLEERLGRKELRFRWNHSRALVAAFIEIQPSPDFDRTLAPLIKDANRQSLASVEVDRRFTRRQALTAIGTVGLGAFLAACASNSTTTTVAGSSTTSTTGSTSTSGTGATTGATTAITAIDCVLVPEMTEGPYYLDLDLVRSDITEDRVGAPLALTIVVASVDGCSPIQDAAVDLWHCDAEGIYSGFVAASTGQGSGTDDSIFLRGTQLTDANGRVTFQTLYPGWYAGRTVHMHMKVHVGGNQIHTTQLFFDDTYTDQVYAANEPYASRNNRDILNGDDGIYGGGGEATTLAVTADGDGYAATLVVGVQA